MTKDEPKKRKPYSPPALRVYGDVRVLTRTGAASRNEGSPTQKKTTGSDRRLKEEIIPMGCHPLGIRLYLFRYRPEFRDRHGHGMQLGVMADELETVMPAAVTRDADGYRQVNYALLDTPARREAE